jgi:hypothetical protein
MEERFNAVRGPRRELNCPICYRADALVRSLRDRTLYRCNPSRDDGCFARFRFEPATADRPDTLLRIREPAEVRRLTPEELAEVRGGPL